MAKVSGIGGIFFKSERPNELKEWYKTYLKIPCDQYGWSFVWLDPVTGEKGLTQWSIMDKRSEYFHPSEQSFMINYRVDDLNELLEDLKAQGVDQVGKTESFSYGKFAWIMDPDGNKIELWEPVDEALLNSE